MLAAEEAGKELPSKDFEGDDAAALAFVISANMKRRHLTDWQRAKIADKIANLGEGRRPATASNEAVSQPDAAKKMNTSRTAVQRAATIRKQAVPELQEQVDREEVSPSGAAEVSRLPADEQRELVATGPAAVVKAAAKISEPEPVVPDGWVAGVLNPKNALYAMQVAINERLEHVAREIAENERANGIIDMRTARDLLVQMVEEAVDEFDDDVLSQILQDARAVLITK